MLTLYIDNSIICCNNHLKMNDLFSNFIRVVKIKYSEYFFGIYIYIYIENRKNKELRILKMFKKLMQKKVLNLIIQTVFR